MTNLGVKPLGRGSEPSKRIAKELEIFQRYKERLISLFPINSEEQAAEYTRIWKQYKAEMDSL